MARQERLEKYKKKKERRKVKGWLIALIIMGIVIVYMMYQIYSLKSENLELTRDDIKAAGNVTTEHCSAGDYTAAVFNGLLSNQNYSLFVKFLIFLGCIYLLMIFISIFADLTELLAFIFILIRGMFRKLYSYYSKIEHKT